jgi:hypothetical protein
VKQAARIAAPASRRELGVIVSCHDMVCAIATRWVERLVLPEDVVELGPNLVNVAGTRYAAWDLGERLGLSPLRAAWVLMRVPMPIALRTGPCLVVEPLPERIELPPLLFVSRRGAVAGVFASKRWHDEALFGLELDVDHLWTPAELAASATLIASGNA